MSPRTCPKCDGCNHEDPRHHWLEDGGSLTGYVCKHCEAIAVECGACGGEGCFNDGDEERSGGECPECGGQGLVEVVAITLEEVQRLRGFYLKNVVI